MPNWSINHEIITGPKEEIKNLYSLLTEWTSKNYMENGFGTKWLGNIVKFAGFNITDEDPVHGFKCRGSISESFELENINENEAKITFASETAWAPIPRMWYAVLKKFAPHSKYYYFSEECGMQLYVSNDIDHKFFNDEYIVDTFYDDDTPEIITKNFPESGYHYSHQDIIQGLQNILNTTEEDFDTLHQILNKKKEKETIPLCIDKIIYETDEEQVL